MEGRKHQEQNTLLHYSPTKLWEFLWNWTAPGFHTFFLFTHSCCEMLIDQKSVHQVTVQSRLH